MRFSFGLLSHFYCVSTAIRGFFDSCIVVHRSSSSKTSPPSHHACIIVFPYILGGGPEPCGRAPSSGALSSPRSQDARAPPPRRHLPPQLHRQIRGRQPRSSSSCCCSNSVFFFVIIIEYKHASAQEQGQRPSSRPPVMGYREGRDVEGNGYKRIRRNLFQIKLCA